MKSQSLAFKASAKAIVSRQSLNTRFLRNYKDLVQAVRSAFGAFEVVVFERPTVKYGGLVSFYESDVVIAPCVFALNIVTLARCV